MATHAALILDWQQLTDTQRTALLSTDASTAVVQSALAAGHFSRYDLDAADLEDVFYRLNVDHPLDYNLRSLSVGDVVITLATNTHHLCAPTGWTTLPPLHHG